jgi:hypothetical protein
MQDFNDVDTACGVLIIRGPFAKIVDWRQCAAVMQREAVTCGDGSNVVVA